jgi:hypothetical protein
MFRIEINRIGYESIISINAHLTLTTNFWHKIMKPKKLIGIIVVVFHDKGFPIKWVIFLYVNQPQTCHVPSKVPYTLANRKS